MKIHRALMILAAAAALSGCATPRGTSVKGLEIPIEKAAIRLSADVREGGYKLVSTDELKKWIDEGRAVTIVDTLPAADRARIGHIANSVNAPMPMTEKELTPAATDALLAVAGTDKERAFVAYCGFVACRRSHHAAKALADAGFKNVFRYPGGTVAWTEAGHPLVK